MSVAALNARLQRTLPMGHIEVTTLPDCQGLRLALINADFPDAPLPGEVMREVMRAPPYWCLCWGSGLALARLLLAEPDWVRGRQVCDLGSGSGVAAIAAAKAGAAAVTACDIDPDAQLATTINAELNAVQVQVSEQLPDHSDLILMADVLYDQQNYPLLELARASASQVLVADTRIRELPSADYREITTLPTLTHPNLGEFDEFRVAHIFST